MTIERLVKIVDPEFQQQLWDFYHTMFLELNKLTPLSQTLDKPRFRSWLKSSKAIKLVVRDGSQVKGFAIVSGDLRHDPLISIPYWKSVYPGKKIYHFPVIAISEEFRTEHSSTCLELMQRMMGEIPRNAVAIFFHSELANPAMPRLVKLSCRGKAVISKIDSMACVLCDWNNGSSS